MRTPKEDLPERIYLLPDFYDGIEGYTWCDDPNPSGEYAPDEVQAYVKESSRSPGCYPVLNALLAAIKYIAGECHKYPNDSVRDIVNDAFQDNDLPYYAEWDENDNTENPIIILSR